MLSPGVSCSTALHRAQAARQAGLIAGAAVLALACISGGGWRPRAVLALCALVLTILVYGCNELIGAMQHGRLERLAIVWIRLGMGLKARGYLDRGRPTGATSTSRYGGVACGYSLNLFA